MNESSSPENRPEFSPQSTEPIAQTPGFQESVTTPIASGQPYGGQPAESPAWTNSSESQAWTNPVEPASATPLSSGATEPTPNVAWQPESTAPMPGAAPASSQYSYTRDQLNAAGVSTQESVYEGHRVYEQARAEQARAEQARAEQAAAGQTAAYQPARGAHVAPNSYVSPAAEAVSPVTPPAAAGSKFKGGQKGNGKGGAKTFVAGFAGAAVACALCLGGTALFGGFNTTGALNAAGGSSTVLGGSGGAITATSTDSTLAEQVASKALPSVVSIDVYVSENSAYGQYGYGGTSSDQLTQSSLGSGVVISEDGYIVTNYHVVEGAEALKVTIEGSEYDATVVGSDPSSDIAVIKVKDAGDTKFTAIDLGDSDQITIGEWVMSIGSPFGLEQSVATGIVSATSRSQIMNDTSSSYSGNVTIYPNMIQTDAAINPGNSGGALVDSQGRLIGINTMITSYSGNYSGVGFAIPVNYAIDLAKQIIDGKTISHAQLGVNISSVDSATAQRYGFAVSSGAYVSSVSEGSGAEEAGLKVGDIITKIDDTKVSSGSDLMLAIRSHKVGETVSVEFNRDGETKTVEAKLGSDSSSQESTQSQNAQKQESAQGNESFYERLFEELGIGGIGGQGSQGNQDNA